jgi:hypothetical protein
MGASRDIMNPMPAWTSQCSVDVDVPVSFAWQFMTDVRNWSDPPAEFTLEGPFAVGTCGTTRMPGQPATSWIIRDVDPGRSYTIAGALGDDALLLFHWRFDALSDRHCRLTQRLELCGDGAAKFVDIVQSGFEANLEPGMRRIAQMLVGARRGEHG